MTASAHAKPPQCRQPKTDAGATRQGKLHRWAPNMYPVLMANAGLMIFVQGKPLMHFIYKASLT